jgi:hypothetical protein
VSTVLWRDLRDGGLDRCRLEAGPAGLRLEGTALTAAFGAPLEVRYLIGTEPAGRTRTVELELDGARHELRADDAEEWSLDGRDLPEVRGCLDVDLEVTPATNTLPIRRLGLDPGGAATLRVAWVRFPGLEVVLSEQRYERLAADRWRYRAGSFEAELRVDPDGLVLDYQGGWRAVAYAGGRARIVREAGPADAGAIATLVEAGWRVAGGGVPGGDRGTVQLVAQDGDRVVGWVQVGPAGDQDGPGAGELHALCVEPSAFQRGAAGELEDAALAALRAAGYGEAVSWTREGDGRAEAFHRARGWWPDGGRRLRDLGGEQATEARHRRQLRSPAAAGG